MLKSKLIRYACIMLIMSTGIALADPDNQMQPNPHEINKQILNHFNVHRDNASAVNSGDDKAATEQTQAKLANIGQNRANKPGSMIINIQDQILQEGPHVSRPNKEKCEPFLPVDTYRSKNYECICIANIHYPTLIKMDDKIAEKINKVVKEFAEGFTCNTSEFSLGEYVLTYKILALRPPFISIEFTYTRDIGGAHPLHGVESLNFDTRTGERIFLSDLVKPEKYSEVNTYVFNQLIEDKKSFFYGRAKEINENGEIIQNFNEQSFYINNDGLIIQFNPYEAGPYSSGIITVQLPNKFINQERFENNVTGKR